MRERKTRSILNSQLTDSMINNPLAFAFVVGVIVIALLVAVCRVVSLIQKGELSLIEPKSCPKCGGVMKKKKLYWSDGLSTCIPDGHTHKCPTCK